MNRRGSALLIVLGVLSFLVVSAVAFSAFMRRARQPSSYLRRVVASRQLAKAALSRAIDEIDHAIASDVHPGVGDDALRTWTEGVNQNIQRSARNRWRSRVFLNCMTPPPDEPSEAWVRERFSQTAPVLTLEGLAYIPPPLVTEARYWSRITPTAEWQSIPYDIGRYAYCAIDVSDYFDVNRLIAGYPRSSAANSRVTIAHLFEDVNHSGKPSSADAWDTFMDEFREFDDDPIAIKFDSSSKIPLVSMADFYLAFPKCKAGEEFTSYFSDCIISGGYSAKKADRWASMTFVTDGWFPQSKYASNSSSGGNNAQKKYDLSDGRYQPFQMANLQKDSMKLSQALLFSGMNKQSGETYDLWSSRLGGLGCAALADYLDADRTPISLAVPTTERVPMICGISPQLGSGQFKVLCEGHDKEPVEKSKQGDLQRTVEATVKWTIDGSGLVKAFAQGRVQALAVYPFLHKEDGEPSFELDGQFSLFFSSEDMRLRTGGSDVLHLAQNQVQDSAIDSATGVIRVKLPKGNPSPKTLSQGVADTQEDAVWDSGMALTLSGGSQLATELAGAGHELLKVVYTWQQSRETKEDQWKPSLSEIMDDPSRASDVQATCGLPALKRDGTVDSDFTANLSQNVKNANWSKELKMNAAVWLRVVNKTENKVVDMVPASVLDDKIQNPSSSDPDPRAGYVLEASGGGSGLRYPLMRFDTGVTFSFGVKKLLEMAENATAQDIEITPKAALVGDPRFNHAPEHWHRHDSQELSAQEWLNDIKDIQGGEHDSDIFLATSDAGYMQSVYELAFIPRFSNLATGSSGSITGDYQDPTGANFASLAAKGSERNRRIMWTSYDPIDLDETAFNDLPFTSEGTGIKVNPYSDSTNVLMAAFANTPISWRFAHTNYVFMEKELKQAKQEDVGTFNTKYAWCDYNESGAGFAWEDLEKVAGKFMRSARDKKNWQDAWNELGWYDSDGEDEFLGLKMGNTDRIWEADKKFFYGFWRDCFAARQQLFLIFVRAEPLILGGGSADQLPPQLGARAVALVWRDPSTSSTGTSNGYPHRTRVLFYRPLD